MGVAREIVETGQLNASYCETFGRNLAYFFVLRPAYKLSEGRQKSDQISRFPFVFVVSPALLGAPYHVYPFDTGAATMGTFGDRPDPTVFLEDYELAPDLEAISGHIDWGFGSSSNYYDGELRDGLLDKLHHWETVARSYIQIAGLASPGHNQPDRRASSIEVAYQDHIKLKRNASFAVIPKQWLEDESGVNSDFIARLDAIGVEWDVYDWQPNKSPEDYYRDISRLVRAHVVGTGK